MMSREEQKLEIMLLELFERNDVKDSFVSYVSGFSDGLQIAIGLMLHYGYKPPTKQEKE